MEVNILTLKFNELEGLDKDMSHYAVGMILFLKSNIRHNSNENII